MRQTIHKTVALILMSLYLLLPAAVFAHASPPKEIKSGAVSVKVPDLGSPYDGCPCSESQDVDCCESACHCCYAPLGKHVNITYSPFVAGLFHSEHHQKPPQVYMSIFVPPQNFFA